MARPQAPPIGINRWTPSGWSAADDQVAAEEPLQVLLNGRPLSIVMRTPGHDLELAVGLLWAERVLRSRSDLTALQISAEAGEIETEFRVEAGLLESNMVDVVIKNDARPPGAQLPQQLGLRRLRRHDRRRPRARP